MSLIKNHLRKIRNSPQNFKHFLYQKFPEALGHQLQGDLIQLYLHNSDFTTALSFNHFIHFFSNNESINIEVKVQAWDQNGKSLGHKSFTLERRGAKQIFLKDLFPNLDSFGLYAVDMKITPKFVPDLKYLGTLSPQFMTLFIPTESPSAPQMIHSHKKKQGFLSLPRHHHRLSSDLESLANIQELEIYVLNSSASQLKAGIQIVNGKDRKLLKQKNIQLNGYAVKKVTLKPSELKTDFISFEYTFNRSVDHKKPIICRRFQNGSLSCNHT